MVPSLDIFFGRLRYRFCSERIAATPRIPIASHHERSVLSTRLSADHKVIAYVSPDGALYMAFDRESHEALTSKGLLPLVGANDECVMDAVLSKVTTRVAGLPHLTKFLDRPMAPSDLISVGVELRLKLDRMGG